MLRTLPLLLLLTLSCATAPRRAGDSLWIALQPLCGQAFEGKVVEGTEPSDAQFRQQRLVMVVGPCTSSEVRIPFHVGQDRSRTWVISRTADGLRLKHDHRHEDGTPDRVTQYGGDTRPGDNDLVIDFFADSHTAELLPAAATNIWTLAIVPGRTFSYALRRDAEGRRFRVDFDLARPLGPW